MYDKKERIGLVKGFSNLSIMLCTLLISDSSQDKKYDLKPSN